MATIKDIKYLNKDFNVFKRDLVNYSKTYFPTTYNNFTNSSVGMMFMEMASYVGDVMSFYLDNQIEENFIQYARESKNIFNLAYMMGYKPKVTGVATTEVTVYQQIPAKSFAPYDPDYSYALNIPENTTIGSSQDASSFLIQDSIDFSFSSSLDPTEISVYSVNGGVTEYYLLSKKRKAVSATIQSTTSQFGAYSQYPTIEINAQNIIGILDIVDSEGNTWYEVDYLGQEMVPVSIKNTNINDPNFNSDQNETPYLLKYKKVANRFVTRFTNSGTLQIQFGSGNANDINEEITPNPDNVGIGLLTEKEKLTVAYDPSNFLYTNTYGTAPTNTTLTIRYLTGGGAAANAPSNTLIDINNSGVTFVTENQNTSLANYVFNSLSSNNLEAARGGSNGDTLETIRQNALVTFQTQKRAVTQQDYLVRALSMPPQYGSLAKAYIERAKLNTLLPGELNTTLDLYVLAQNSEGQLVNANTSLKRNLQTYLSEYRVIGDNINIKDAFVVNMGVNFEIIVLPNYNSNNVLLKCIDALKTFFNIEKWSINQPILLRDLYVMLDEITGVQTVKNITLNNITSTGYSQYAYDIEGATLDYIVYPSIDPMIFEIKYPNTDIKGKVVNL